MSPVLPWELIESVVDQACHDFDLLHSFSLTCRQLHSRSLLVMINHIPLNSRDKAFAFYDFLRTDTGLRLREHVRSLTISPVDVPHLPPLHMLPNLSTLSFISRKLERYYHEEGRPTVRLHTSHLWCYHRYGQNIRTLELGHLSLSACIDLCRLILAFPNTTKIICHDIIVKGPAMSGPVMDVLGAKLSRPQLATVNIHSGVDESVTSLLLDCARSTVQTLMLTGLHDILPAFSMPSEWKWLHTLTIGLELGKGADSLGRLTEFLKNFRPPSLEDVSVHFLVTHRHILNQCFDDERLEETNWIDVCSKLEAALSTFRRQRLSFLVSLEKPAREHLWTRELGQLFPALRDRGRLTVACKSIAAVGHERLVWAVVVSPDSKWIASGSWDNTIIVWDSDGRLCDEWMAHYSKLNSLAFSLDSRFLASAGSDRKVVVWDLNQDARRVATLEGHSDEVLSCAWSPDGTMIASGGVDKTVRLWDTKTFQQAHLFDRGHERKVRFVQFSPDGHWLASGGEDHHCCIWDVASGTLHKIFGGLTRELRAAAFDPGSTRLATASWDDTVRIWDVETAESIFVSRQHTNWVEEVEFSPDGSLLLSASWDKTVKIWDTSTGVMIMSLDGHSNYMSAAFFSPCGRYIASASMDKTVRLWRTSDGSCVATFSEHQSWLRCVAFSPDGKTLSSGAHNGSVFIRRLDQVISDKY
ncbi:WD40-repeat-containing domain protein [Dichomitus squalens]|uniref:WD40-repeat-containing domain protein n=1 Tax=Dichomitus squalens TaxID=114155 RepID=A0A4Q9Q415_9APHY|nr:WD40-repeat-containing domain protein [Dichomitus squalens]